MKRGGAEIKQEHYPGEVFSSLKALSNKFSITEQRIANYLLEHPHQFIRQSITEVAEACRCAEASIFRFSKRLGFDGFQALKIALASAAIEPTANIKEDVDEEDSLALIARKVFRANTNAIEDTLRLLDPASLEQAVELLAQARRVEFYGCGGSAVLALDAYHKFLRTGIQCSAVTDSHLQVMSAVLLNEKDLVVAISHSGTNKDVYEAVKEARDRGAKVISVTDYNKTPLGKMSTVCFVASSVESQFRTEAMAARFAQLSILDTLYVGVAMKREQETLENLAQIRRVIAKKRF
ncbi:Sugar isomerase (SIS) [Acididesulfobacillus acetoxydans]|uniref:HTH-type transcriptional regulator HexR n=1 Tax=Acididesulfobacillus acetoxydans TaxID=1561005 RepID=A0A8S0W4Y4_9FIRM|nr:MurR/RpiR family transcriptional regulator [Acididesulfobacillus acetoxydans]CAA7602678.1 Sugar isomerase (SIS) [Acididesulfobacillus acetoxydans]CEJ09151.1 HTH-type transcriptional regulator HexR [Acididesulfobacillus acetoxydans]